MPLDKDLLEVALPEKSFPSTQVVLLPPQPFVPIETFDVSERTEKNSERHENLPARNFGALSETPFRPAQEYDSQPPAREPRAFEGVLRQ